ncbi:MAG TPA: sigma 54-interacting transcriptional regulator [Syntrophales bacterium]|nr:sigma 54-interacting transcriptional regulator [Syntrophales bacterium]
MKKIDTILSNLSDEERHALYSLVAFPNRFSVDWFGKTSDLPPSALLTVMLLLKENDWISPVMDRRGYYEWTERFPRDEILAGYGEEAMSRYYRNSVDILREVPDGGDEESALAADQCILAGLEPEDLGILLKAAVSEEKNHRISSAIRLYDHLLDYMDRCILGDSRTPSRELLCTYIRAVEKRAPLSLFNPDLKKIDRFLARALEIAVRIGDARATASLHLISGQNCWMLFKYEDAVAHFNLGWEIITGLDDEALFSRGMKTQGLSLWIKGNLFEAIQYYEKSLGEIESIDGDDFSLVAALNLALAYTQIGLPQRGLGISDTIQKHAQRAKNWPVYVHALVIAGMILLEIRQLKDSRPFFTQAFELAEKENILTAQVMAGMGLANIDFLEGNYESASIRYKILSSIRKSNWYHFLNQYHLVEIGYLLHSKGISPIDLHPVFEFLGARKKEDVNPVTYSWINRLQITYLQKDCPPKEKILQLTDLEKYLAPAGETLELAKLRIEIALLSMEINEWRQVEHYAKKAWDFLKPVARDLYPPKLRMIVSHEAPAREDRLYDLIIEMGNALISQDKIEHLLTNIITSISRMTGAERTAIFIRNPSSSEIELVASRNIVKEDLDDDLFAPACRKIQDVVDGNDGRIVQYGSVGENHGDSRKVIITPLMLGSRTIGVLYQDSRFFSIDRDRVDFLSALASQIAISIDRAQAYDEIAKLNERLIQENRYYYTEEFRPFGEIIGASASILSVHQLIAKVAPTSSTVLILGETGVGKEIVARAIHRESPRRNRPFIRVNCAALPDTLIDSELFGHEKGAFTGAVKTKAGRFELAHEGTIFLDEISELPLPTQSRLLRILQEKEFQRVGGTATLRSDFRLVSATNRDLEKEVERGRFRADLFYRLNVFPIRVAPLRDRKEDIPLLAVHFLRLFSSQYNKEFSGIPESEMNKLMAYSWPGNVRELSNMIERAVILESHRIRFPELDTRPPADGPDQDFVDLAGMEKRQIMRALEKSNGKIGGRDGAAAFLGLNRTTLIYRMKKYGISLVRNTIQQT